MSFANVAASMLGRLEGKVAIITGGAGDIGEAAVRLFSKHGAKVIIADIADEAGEKLAQTLSPWASYIHCDVSKEHHVSAAVDFAMKNQGRLDIMFNNAGVRDSSQSSATNYKMEEFDRVFNTNVKGVMHGIKHAARVMIPNKKGCIISTSSVSSIMAGFAPYAYTASKHAVDGLTKNGAAELGKYGIRVNSVSPAPVVSELAVKVLGLDRAQVEAMINSVANLKGATLTGEDIAEAALYLASEEAKYVSGHNLVVDGGITVVNHDWGMQS